MEALVQHNPNLELNDGAKKLMLGMIASIKSLVPSHPALVPHGKAVHPGFLKDFVKETARIAFEREEELLGLADPGLLEKYLMHAGDFREIGDRLEQLLKSIRDYQNLAGILAYQLATLIKEHLELTKPGSCESLDHIEQKIMHEEIPHKSPAEERPKLRVV